MQSFHAISGGGDHAFNKVVFPLGHRHFQQTFSQDVTAACGDRQRLIVKLHTLKQGRALSLIERMLDSGLVDFGNLFLLLCIGVDELSVIGKQQQARRIGIQPTN